MLDIKFIRENTKLVKDNNESRNVTIDVDHLIKIDSERTALLQEIEKLRAERNSGSKNKPTPEEIKKMKEVGEHIATLEEQFKELDTECQELVLKIPNINHTTTPQGKK